MYGDDMNPKLTSVQTRAQHTQGPWITDGWCVRSRARYVIAEINPLHDEYARPLTQRAESMAAEARANLSLLAAAPELLAALRDFVAPYDGNMENAPTVVKLGRAAIAKAEGRPKDTPAGR